ncbi:MAG: hypothetical protein FJX42_07135 [Alphaproteobacteria bacterium]|nr:hypothetical protein [Alphaproteobacteria bacterium]
MPPLAVFAPKSMTPLFVLTVVAATAGHIAGRRALPPMPSPGVLALTPWTIGFDQHFALYMGNLTKAGLVVGGTLFLLAWIGRKVRWR